MSIFGFFIPALFMVLNRPRLPIATLLSRITPVRPPTRISLLSRPATTGPVSAVPATSALLPTPTLATPTPVPILIPTPGPPEREGKPSQIGIKWGANFHHSLDSPTRTTPTSSPTGSGSGGNGAAAGLGFSSFGVAGVIGAIAALF